MSVTDMLRGTKKQDEWRTPAYAVRPLIRYLKRGTAVLCPFDDETSNFVSVLRDAGHVVGYGHISEGYDFFDISKDEARHFDYIISNPPYSIKDAVFAHLLFLERPFAMLMGATAGLFEGKRFGLFEKAASELLWLKPRVAFIDQEGKAMRSPPFQACYVCRGVLPRKIMFARVQKEEI
jgi:hypothetical protein